MSLAENKKLTVIFRVEPGCLGPDGASHVERFCVTAKMGLKKLHPNFIAWQVVPRYDKNLPEVDYAINGKGLPREFATRYLAQFDEAIDSFEMALFDEVPDLIDQYFGR